MKRFSALLCVVVVAVMLSACQALHGDTTKEYPAAEPLTMAVFLQLQDKSYDVVDALQFWMGDVARLIETTPDDGSPRITAAAWREEYTADSNTDTYTVDLTLTHVPATTVRRVVRPFKITITQTVFNPIGLLPQDTVFTYIVAYTTTNRHSAVNTDWITTDEDGSYVYFWTTDDNIEFVDHYPNRPLYYVLVLVGAAVVGGVVYLVSRYCDCKKPQKQL